ECARLPREGEVAILVINMNSMNDTGSVIRGGKAIWLSDFTKDRGQLAAAFAKVPPLIEVSNQADAETTANEKKPEQADKKGGLSISADTEKKVEQAPPKP